MFHRVSFGLVTKEKPGETRVNPGKRNRNQPPGGGAWRTAWHMPPPGDIALCSKRKRGSPHGLSTEPGLQGADLGEGTGWCGSSRDRERTSPPPRSPVVAWHNPSRTCQSATPAHLSERTLAGVARRDRERTLPPPRSPVVAWHDPSRTCHTQHTHTDTHTPRDREMPGDDEFHD